MTSLYTIYSIPQSCSSRIHRLSLINSISFHLSGGSSPAFVLFFFFPTIISLLSSQETSEGHIRTNILAPTSSVSPSNDQSASPLYSALNSATNISVAHSQSVRVVSCRLHLSAESPRCNTPGMLIHSSGVPSRGCSFLSSKTLTNPPLQA